MPQEYINDLIDRLKSSSTPQRLREEVINVISTYRQFLMEVHLSAKQNHDRSGEYLSGIALGKSGYTVSDAGF